MSTWRTLHDHPELWERYFIREKVIQSIRAFFDKEGFHEVETPILIAHPPAESYHDVFETTLLDRHRHPTKAYLATSPEVALKKLLVAGIGNCYSITKTFRNMEMQSILHNPEFTMLEWYRVGASYVDIMNDCERLVRNIYMSLYPAKKGLQVSQFFLFVYQGQTIDLIAPWERMTVAQSFQRYAGVNFDEFLDEDSARKITSKKGYTVEEKHTWEELYNQIFLNEIEPHLGIGKPTILYDFPAAMGALVRTKASDPRFVERFEFYIAGLELGDCYGELTDPVEQKNRFDRELAEVKRLGKTSYEYDNDFIEALKVGLPVSSGIGIGIDRLIMLFADVVDIADVLFFPARDEFPLPA